MQWQCLKDYFGYCKGEPQWEKPAEEVKDSKERSTGIFLGGICQANPAICGQYLKNSELGKANES